jgi:hypothetical protein
MGKSQKRTSLVDRQRRLAATGERWAKVKGERS